MRIARASEQTEPDATLLTRIVAGDLDALGVLFDRYHHDVRRFLLRLGVSSDLDDLVQLAFLEVIGAARNFDPQCSARAWLLGIAATMVRRRRRSLSRISSRLSAWVLSREEPHSETPSETFEGREAEARIVRALGEMAPRKREAFVMVVLEGASGEEAAFALGVPLNTIWTRLHHARDELRHALRKDSR